MSRDWLEEHQIAFYFAAVVAAAIAGLSSAQFTGLTAMAITPAIAVLMYAMFLQIPWSCEKLLPTAASSVPCCWPTSYWCH